MKQKDPRIGRERRRRNIIKLFIFRSLQRESGGVYSMY